MDELKDRGYEFISTEPIVYCRAFKDNSGALKIARLPKMRPRTKAMNIIYHHFWKYVRLGMIKTYPIFTHDQVANMFNKPLTHNTFSGTTLKYAVDRSLHARFERECEITRNKNKEKYSLVSSFIVCVVFTYHRTKQYQFRVLQITPRSLWHPVH